MISEKLKFFLYFQHTVWYIYQELGEFFIFHIQILQLWIA